jgi:hypothetical protein
MLGQAEGDERARKTPTARRQTLLVSRRYGGAAQAQDCLTGSTVSPRGVELYSTVHDEKDLCPRLPLATDTDTDVLFLQKA